VDNWAYEGLMNKRKVETVLPRGSVVIKNIENLLEKGDAQFIKHRKCVKI
jgi:hypothetical protein